MTYKALKLALAFDAERLKADIADLSEADWIPHFNAGYHDGGWSGVALRAPGSGANALYPDPAQDHFADTPLLARCPYIRDVLSAFECPLLSARLLKLRAGSTIREHRDHDLGFEDGEVRLHVPVITNPFMEFYLDGERLPMEAGQTWYVNVNLPHRVRNLGVTDRIHLVIDCKVNDWLAALFAAGHAPARAPGGRHDPGPGQAQGGGIEAFRRLVWSDPSLQDALFDTEDPELFLRMVREAAGARGYVLAEDDMRAEMRRVRRAWHQRSFDSMSAGEFAQWAPVHVHGEDDRLLVDWCRLDGERFHEPFFDDSCARLLRRPFNRLFRRQTSLEFLDGLESVEAGLPPTGLIFHSSRCGSTLVSQMLATLPSNIVLAEAAPIDAVLQLRRDDPAIGRAQRAGWLRGVVSALGRQRRDGERHLFVKFDSWNIIDLPLICEAFPSVPWVFIYRDPVEVLTSHMRQRGMHMVPGMIQPELFGMTREEALALAVEEFCARVLASICAAAARHLEEQGGMAINYTQLPAAAWSSMASFFGVDWTAREREAMRATAGRDAKNPSFEFREDRAAKLVAASAALRAASEKWVSRSYERLEALRTRG